MRQNGQRSNVRFPTGTSGMKKGGKVKKQGANDRLDESLGSREMEKNQLSLNLLKIEETNQEENNYG